MTDQDNAVFAAYTPLRNHLRQTGIEKSIRAIHAHLQHLQYNNKLPPYIVNTPQGYENLKEVKDYLNFHIFPWELEILTKEVLINSDLKIEGRKSLEDWNYLAVAINKLKDLENNIYKIYGNENNVLLEIYRIAHRQFHWQKKSNMEEIGRYWTLYKYPKLDNIIQDALGMKTDDLYLLGFSLIGLFTNKIALNYPPNINLKNLTLNDLNKFLSHFSISIDLLRQKLKDEQEMNEKYVYAFNSLKRFPLIKMPYGNKESIVCPVPTLLYRRLTEGLYYEVVDMQGFDSAYGESFQGFIGELIKNGNSKINVIPEAIYGKSSEGTVDWIIEDKTTLLFVECKGKRITIDAKSSLLDSKELERQLDIMAGFVVQIYKTFLDYTKGFYPNVKYNSDKIVYPLIVTLEEWYIFGNKVLDYLDERIRSQLTTEEINPELLTTNPYTICSVDGLDMLLQASKHVDISKILQNKHSDRETQQWQLETFMQNKYNNELHNMNTIFSDRISSHIDSLVK